jgi:hypothetical protein
VIVRLLVWAAIAVLLAFAIGPPSEMDDRVVRDLDEED